MTSKTKRKRNKTKGGMLKAVARPLGKATMALGESIGKDYVQTKSVKVAKGLYDDPNLIKDPRFILTANKSTETPSKPFQYPQYDSENINPNVLRGGKTKNRKISRNKTVKKIKYGSGKIKKINCSPKPKDEMNDFTCYTNKSLIQLRDRWNARHPDVKIKTNSPKEIHKQLSEHLHNICNNEACWLRQKGAFGQLESELSDSFAPESPPEWKKNPNEWLSSTDIMKVMKQYEKAYKCFDFIGPSPIDFDTRKLYGECVWEELCNISLSKLLKKGKTKIGIIFNTDPHNKPGQHWISMFINIKKKQIFFFDSTGDPAPSEIKKLIERLKEQGLSLNPKIHFKVDSNEGVEHQYGNTECGIYSIFFIVHMLEDKVTDHYLKTHILKDEYIEKFRHIYFNDSL